MAFGTGEVTGQFVQDRLGREPRGDLKRVRICLSPEAPASREAQTAYTEPLLLVQPSAERQELLRQ